MTQQQPEQQQDDHHHSNHSRCIFCRIARHEIKPGRRDNPQELVYESDSVVAFNDVAPVSDFHVLIIPKAVHLRTCWELTPALLQEMTCVAQTLLQQHQEPQPQQQPSNNSNNNTLIFFSRPPFLSVPHVHLHVITRPLTKWTWWNPLHYHYYLPALQVTPDQVKMHLEQQPPPHDANQK